MSQSEGTIDSLIAPLDSVAAQMAVEPNSGSLWHRWEPHIHAPGTVLNDQFKGPGAWENYLTALEDAAPIIRAIGVADYYSTETYERVRAAKKAGRLQACQLVFPNIEMRLAIGTVKGRWVNIHLLVSPEDPEHLSQLRRFLARLTFDAYGDSFSCNRDDLIRLGQRHDPQRIEERSALECGSEQFKVSFDQLKQLFGTSEWAQRNIIVAVAGSETDGTSGVREGADATLRQEVEKFAHVIFAGSPAQRDFWLGRRSASPDVLRALYGGPKPCLHGSDAHEEQKVGVPDGGRYSWVKGALHFDSLRQACIDPAGRAHVGLESPAASTPSRVISHVQVVDAPWALTPQLALNPGLVAIIGARGSGKTALADMIALGCDATAERHSPGSFLTRAAELLHNASVKIRWQSDETNHRSLDGSSSHESSVYSKARYLSQQFVEELCSADGVTDSLMLEIERVIFDAHTVSDRDGAVDFDELRAMRASRFRVARSREEEALANLSDQIAIELGKQKLVESLRKQVAEKQKLIAGYVADRAKLVAKGSEVRVARLTALSSAADKVRGYLRYFNFQEQALLSLRDEVGNVRTNQAPDVLRKLQERYKATGLKPNEWTPFLLDYAGDVDTSLREHLAQSQADAKTWRGTPPLASADVQIPLIPDDANLEQCPLAALEAESSRLGTLVSVDKETANKFAAVSKRITEETVALTQLEQRFADCEGAKARVKALADERENSYRRVFDAIAGEHQVLVDLYEPLRSRLSAATGTLKKLSFSVSREVDVELWASEGERLLDLRQKGPFKGRGTLAQIADTALKAEWESGTSASVAEAMTRFRSANQDELLEHSQIPKADHADYRVWAKQFAKWLYGTEHISIRYSIDYDGVDIRKLSPGTRGIVLLLLYLALDDSDDRPLIIDQPEENLDPKSIHDELVGLFLEAKKHRQVIMVTHNANLVVNTDADQVIVASVGPHIPGELPPITYVSGGLESAPIRKAVCDILEGGERAFQERARRLRVRLER